MADGSGIISPLANPAAYDVIRIGLAVSPGYCVISGFDRESEWDVKKGKGTKGATLTYVQNPPVEGEIEFFLWDDGRLGTGHNHFEEWATFSALLETDPSKKKPEGLPIFHPFLADRGINAVICLKIGTITRSRELMFSVKCKFLEYTTPPKKSVFGTASGTAKTSPAGAAAKSVSDAAQAMNDALKNAIEPNAADAQSKELDKLWGQYNSDGKDAA